MAKPVNPFDDALWAAPDGPRLLAELDDVSRQIRLLEAQRLDLVGEIDRQGIAVVAGYRKTNRLLVDAIRVAPAVAARMVQRALAVTESVTLTGHVRPAPLPTVRQALHEGLIDGEHIDAVTTTFQHLPQDLDPPSATWSRPPWARRPAPKAPPRFCGTATPCAAPQPRR